MNSSTVVLSVAAIAFCSVLAGSFFFVACTEDSPVSEQPPPDEEVVEVLPPKTWQFLGFHDKQALRLVLDGRTLYACAGRAGLWKRDIGRFVAAWKHVGIADSGSVGQNVKDLLVDGEDGGRLLVANHWAGHSAAYLSEDSGRTWSPSGEGLTWSDGTATYRNCLDRLLKFSDRILAAGSGVFERSRFDDTWSVRWGGYGCGGEVWALAHNRETGSVWAGGISGYDRLFLWGSRDSGFSWTGIDLSDVISRPEWSGVLAIAVSPGDPSTIFLGTIGAIHKSTDDGTTWTTIAETRSAEAGYASIWIDPGDPLHLWASTLAFIIESRDGGESWERLATPADGPGIYDLVSDPVRGTIYVGTLRGVWRYQP